MAGPELHVVTGAFGYSGRYIAARLLQAGCRVRTLTNSPDRPNPFGGKVEAHPSTSTSPSKLVESLRGASVLYNTYWVRFNHGDFGFAEAVREQRCGCSRRPARPASGASSTSASPTPPRTRRWSTSAARRGWNARWSNRACPTPSCGPPCSSAARTSSSTTSPGRCAGFRCSASSATANTACSRSTSRTSPSWPSRRGAASQRDRQRHRPGDVHLSRPGPRDRPRPSANRGRSSPCRPPSRTAVTG